MNTNFNQIMRAINIPFHPEVKSGKVLFSGWDLNIHAILLNSAVASLVGTPPSE